MSKRCARCTRLPHEDRLYLDCLRYVAPAPGSWAKLGRWRINLPWSPRQVHGACILLGMAVGFVWSLAGC